MRSWILRHRLRLRLVYGPPPATTLEPGPELVSDPADVPPGTHPGPYGRVRRTPQGLEVVPMPRRVGRTKQVG